MDWVLKAFKEFKDQEELSALKEIRVTQDQLDQLVQLEEAAGEALVLKDHKECRDLKDLLALPIH
jgi:hypothetical protein